MNALDYLVLLGSLLGIAAYGVWQTRGRRDLQTYLRGNSRDVAGSPSASPSWRPRPAPSPSSPPRARVTKSGLGFVQNYFGAPLALIVISIVFLPIYRRLECLHRLRIPRPPLRRQDPPAWRRAVPAPARARRGHHDLRAGHRAVDRHGLAAGSHHHRHRAGRDRLHGQRRERRGEPDPEVPARDHLLRDVRGVRGSSSAAARGRVGCATRWHAGGAVPQARRGGLLARPEPALHLLVGAARGRVPRALVLRHRPVAGRPLPLGRLAARKPAGADVQRSLQDPDAGLHPAAGRADVRLLPVRAAAGVLQPDRLARRSRRPADG